MAPSAKPTRKGLLVDREITVRTIRYAAAMAALALAFTALPAGAQSVAVPETVTLNLHGTQAIGERDTVVGRKFLTMDTAPPSATEKSMNVTNYVVGPNTDCEGNALVPTWQYTSDIPMTMDGPLEIKLHTLALPDSPIDVKIYADGDGDCTYEDTTADPPALAYTVTPETGQGVTTIKMKRARITKPFTSLTLMLHAPRLSPSQVRVFYDSATSPSSLSFTCLAQQNEDELVESCLPPQE